MRGGGHLDSNPRQSVLGALFEKSKRIEEGSPGPCEFDMPVPAFKKRSPQEKRNKKVRKIPSRPSNNLWGKKSNILFNKDGHKKGKEEGKREKKRLKMGGKKTELIAATKGKKVSLTIGGEKCRGRDTRKEKRRAIQIARSEECICGKKGGVEILH